MNKNGSFAILICFLGLVTTAEGLVLGEFQGASQMSVSIQGVDGKTSSYVNSCKMAYNISLDTNKFDVDFGVVTCDQGLDSWNDRPINLTITNHTVYNSGIEVGLVKADGTISFELSKYQDKLFQVIRYDNTCRPSSIENKKIAIGSAVQYKIQKLSDNSYYMRRSEKQSAAGTITKKEWANCPATYDYAPVVKTLAFDVTLQK